MIVVLPAHISPMTAFCEVERFIAACFFFCRIGLPRLASSFLAKASFALRCLGDWILPLISGAIASGGRQKERLRFVTLNESDVVDVHTHFIFMWWIWLYL